MNYSLYEINEETSRWANQYKETDDKVSAFVEVSNPKTIVSYVKQLRDILDNSSSVSHETIVLSKSIIKNTLSFN